MDSMRSLNTSLPLAASAAGRPSQPSEQLLQAFKAAALSVTNLYKTAASDQPRSYAEGYQDALEDLLFVLDKENLGLCDGEGWRVRQWATERLQGTTRNAASSDSDEEGDDEKEKDRDKEKEDRARSTSPVASRKQHNSNTTLTSSPTSNKQLRHKRISRRDSEPRELRERSLKSPPGDERYARSSDFTFRAVHACPNSSDTEMDASEISSVGSNAPHRVRFEVPVSTTPNTTTNTNTITAAAATTRSSRSSGRHLARGSSRAAANGISTLGTGAGSKRRLPFPELFDFGAFTSGKDLPGNGKRSRNI